MATFADDDIALYISELKNYRNTRWKPKTSWDIGVLDLTNVSCIQVNYVLVKFNGEIIEQKTGARCLDAHVDSKLKR